MDGGAGNVLDMDVRVLRSSGARHGIHRAGLEGKQGLRDALRRARPVDFRRTEHDQVRAARARRFQRAPLAQVLAPGVQVEPVERDRRGLGERHGPLRASVDAAAAPEDDALHTALLGGAAHVQGRLDVRREEIRPARGEVEHGGGVEQHARTADRFPQRRLVADVDPDPPGAFGNACQRHGQIERRHLPAAPEQLGREPRPDESAGTGDCRLHVIRSPFFFRSPARALSREPTGSGVMRPQRSNAKHVTGSFSVDVTNARPT